MSGDEKLYRAVHDPSGHLAEASDGGFLGAVLSNEDNSLMEQARFFEVDSEDLSENGENIDGGGLSPVVIAAAGFALGILATAGVVTTAPKVKAWWLATALPGIQGVLEQLTKRRTLGARAEQQTLLELAAPVEPVVISTELTAAEHDDREVMSSAEAQRRYLAMMLAVAFAAEQMRILEGARVEEPEKLAELRVAAAWLSTQEAADLANRMLEADGSLLDEDSQAMFAAVFGGGKQADGKYLPIEHGRLEDAMRLPGCGED